MTKGGIDGRLARLEARTPTPTRSSDARRRMKRHLDRLAAWRRGELSDEEAAEVEAETAAIEDRVREIRGGGAS